MTDQELDHALETVKMDHGSHLGSVRQRVMGTIESDSRRRRRMVLWTSLAAAAAALIAIVAAIPDRGAKPIGTVVEAQRPAPLRSRLAIPAEPSHPHAARRTTSFRAATVRERAASDTPLEVRMQTDDPDVLIIWLIDGEEEQAKKGTP